MHVHALYDLAGLGVAGDHLVFQNNRLKPDLKIGDFSDRVSHANSHMLGIHNFNHDFASSRGLNRAIYAPGTPCRLLLALVVDSSTVFDQHSIGEVTSNRPIIDCLLKNRPSRE